MHVRNKLSVKQIPKLTSPGVYSDGGGLYLRVRPSGTRSWLFVRMVHGKRREMGLGSVMNVSLAQARDLANKARADFLEGRDPIAERRHRIEKTISQVTFGEMFEIFFREAETGYRNAKHRQQWRSTIKTYCKAMLAKPVDQIDTQDVLSALTPIWYEKHETASRLRGRIEKVLDAAKVNGYRDGENPARVKGHLEHLLSEF